MGGVDEDHVGALRFGGRGVGAARSAHAYPAPAERLVNGEVEAVFDGVQAGAGQIVEHFGRWVWAAIESVDGYEEVVLAQLGEFEAEVDEAPAQPDADFN